jgi:hypothetical protein
VKFSATKLKETQWLKDITSRIQRENLNANIPTFYSNSSYKGDRAYLITTYLPHSIEEYLTSKGAEKND